MRRNTAARKKRAAKKTIIVLLAMVVLAMLIYIPSVLAAGDGFSITGETDNENGLIDITFDENSENLVLLIYDDTAANLAYVIIPPGGTSHDAFPAFTLASLHGGEAKTLYIAVYPESELPNFDIDTCTPGIPEDSLEVEWDAADPGDPASLQSFTCYKREIRRKVVVKEVTVENADGALPPYVVQVGDEVAISVMSNTADAVFSNAILAGQTITWEKSLTPDTDGFYTYTGKVEIQPGLAANTAAAVPFSFTIDGVEIDQDSDLVNTGAPAGVVLTEYAGITAQLTAEISIDTLMQDGFVTAGTADVITLTFGGIERDFYFRVEKLVVGGRDPVTPYDDNGTSASFSLNGMEGLSSGDKLDGITLKVLDEVGASYSVAITNGSDFTYIEPMTPPGSYTISVDGVEKDSGSPPKLIASNTEPITFSLVAEDIYANAKYELFLEVEGTEVSTGFQMVLDTDSVTGDPTDGYTYSVEINASELPGIVHKDEITVARVERNGATLTPPAFKYDSEFASQVITYMTGMQIASMDYEVLASELSNIPVASGSDVYAVEKDIVYFEVELTHTIQNPAVEIAGLVGTERPATEVQGKKNNTALYGESDGLIFYVDSSNTKICGLFQIPATSATPYKAEIEIFLQIEAEYAERSGGNPAVLTTENENHFVTGISTKYKLIYWNPVSPSFSFTMSPTTKLEGRYITAGDQVQVNLSGIHASAITQVKAGTRNINTNSPIAGNQGTYQFNLSSLGDNKENYVSETPITLWATVKNSAGKEYTVEMPVANAFTFITRAAAIDHLTLGFSTDCMEYPGLSPSYYAVSEFSSMTFSFHTNQLYPSDYTVVLGYPNGPKEVHLTKALGGSAVDGYTYTGQVDIADLSGIEDFNEITIAMKEGNTLFPEFTDSRTCDKILYFGQFELLGLTVEYPGYNGEFEWEPDDEYAYIVDGDFIRVTMVFNHSLIQEKTKIMLDNIEALFSSKTDIENIIGTSNLNPRKYTAEHQLRYYLETTKLSNDTVVLYYRVPDISVDKAELYERIRLSFQRETKDQENYEDNVPIVITVDTERHQVPDNAVSVNTGDYGPKKEGGNELFHQMLYWAPLDIWNPEVTLLNIGPDDALPIDDLDEETYVIVRDGQEISITFVTKHQILVDEIATQFSPSGSSSSSAPEISLVYDETKENQSRFVYTASFTIGQDPVSSLDDQTIIKFIWKITDIRSQKTGSIKYSQDTKWAIYYTPLEITEVIILTSNRKDETQFCKDEDTITVSFLANHYVVVDGQTIIDRPGEYEDRRRRHREPTEYQFTYEIQNGDIEDLSFITFAFSATDLAGDMFEFTDASPEVINKIKYYAPLEITAEIESSNARPEYARNGDTITVSTTSNHEAQTLDFRIGSREIGNNETYREDPTVSYRIPDGEEELYEGDMFFSVRLEDPAGNYEMVSETAEEGEEGTKVTYDRTPPEIRILPGFNGFTNEDVGFTFMYNDMFLDMATLSCTLNGTQRIRHVAGTDTSYSHKVELTDEGDYVVSAVAVDMAGNEMEFEAICTLIIDKTNPIIRMQLRKNTFRAGFTLDTITTLVEDNLASMVCTVTDGEGVHDWSLDMPIEKEGKKTVFTLLRDMAGNTSTPISYDIFIDATAPQPQILNAATSEQFEPAGKNFFVGSSASLDISLAPIFMGDEGPDRFTTLQLVDSEGVLVYDFLANPFEEHSFQYKLRDFGNYTLLVAAVDDVGNETGPMLYTIEFREQYLLERLLSNTPLAGLGFIRYINDTMFIVICCAFVLLVAGIITLIILRHRKKKKYMAQEFDIIDE